MFAYQRMLRAIQKGGVIRPNRTGVNTLGIFGYQFRHDLSKGFPLLTTKKMFTKGFVEELLWMLRGETNVRSLQAAGVHIWDEWADKDGELGPVYGAQWRRFGVGQIDQIKALIDGLANDPHGRRHIVTAWNPNALPRQNLPPCHVLMQFDVRDGGRLSCHMYQRSADAFLGVPFNIASYALLTHIIAARVNMIPGDLIISYGDLHIYRNHFDQVEEQLSRRPLQRPLLAYTQSYETETDYLKSVKADDIRFANYNPHPAIKADVAV